jgi:broad specificity phosphatase PhoE
VAEDSPQAGDGVTRLLLVRHGETVGNSSIRYYGRTDVPLAELGRRQMREVRDALVRRFGDRAFDPVFASPLSRAREGAEIITGREPVKIEEFLEVDFGDFEGLTAEEIRARYTAEFARWDRNRLDPAYAYPHGESRAGFVERVHRGVARMIQLIDDVHQERGGNAIVVAHRGVIRAIIQRLAKLAPVIELASVHILVSENDVADWRAELIDETAHLT